MFAALTLLLRIQSVILFFIRGLSFLCLLSRNLHFERRGPQKRHTKGSGGRYNFAVPSSSFHVAWRGHSAAVSSLSWIKSPPSLLSSSADGLAKIWTADGSALLGQVGGFFVIRVGIRHPLFMRETGNVSFSGGCSFWLALRPGVSVFGGAVGRGLLDGGWTCCKSSLGKETFRLAMMLTKIGFFRRENVLWS